MLASTFKAENGGNVFFRNVGFHLQVHTTSQASSEIQYSSNSESRNVRIDNQVGHRLPEAGKTHGKMEASEWLGISTQGHVRICSSTVAHWLVSKLAVADS
jgi:hypothetical protein